MSRTSRIILENPFDSQESVYADRKALAATLYNPHVEDSPRSEFHRLSSGSYSAQRHKSKTQLWIWIVFPLAVHCLFAVGVLCMVLFSINGRVFNITDRVPTITLLDGSRVELEGVKFTLLQSDITTILSFFLAMLRLFSTAWCGTLCWRIALILMEKSGMTIQELNWLTSFGVPPVSPASLRRRPGRRYMLGLGTILILLLPIPLGAPLITGSITWSPANLYYPAYNTTLLANNWNYTGAIESAPGIVKPDRESVSAIEIIVPAASGFQAWGSGNETGIMRRTLTDPGAPNLPVNTTLTNITVPYFEITQFEWLKDPENSLTPQQLGAIDPVNSTYWLNASSSSNPMFNKWGYNAALIHDFSRPARDVWPMTHTVPLVYLASLDLPARGQGANCKWSDVKNNTRFIIQPDATFVQRKQGPFVYCFVFANVTYTAGSANCSPCRISSPLNVQSDAPLQAEDDPTAQHTILTMAQVALQIREYQELTNFRQSKSNRLEQYIVSQLQQTYSATWNFIAENNGAQGQTSVSLPISALQGLVDTKRVWAWFMLQMIITVSGIVFIIVQAHVDQRPIQNATLAPLFINTSDIGSNDDSLHMMVSNERRGVLRLQRAQGELLSRAAYAHPNSN